MVGIERYDTKKKKSKACSIVSGHELSRPWNGPAEKRREYMERGERLSLSVEKEYILSLKLEEEE